MDLFTNPLRRAITEVGPMNYRPPRMEQTIFKIPPERKRALETEAEERRMTLSALLREIVFKHRRRPPVA